MYNIYFFVDDDDDSLLDDFDLLLELSEEVFVDDDTFSFVWFAVDAALSVVFVPKLRLEVEIFVCMLFMKSCDSTSPLLRRI